MNALREMYLDVAGSLLESERKMLREMFAPVEGRLGAIEARLERVEAGLVAVEKRQGFVESQVAQLVRIELVERRLAVVEASVKASSAGGGA